MPYLENGSASIRYEDQGEGFPLLLLAPGGLNSGLRNWGSSGPGPSAAFDPREVFATELRIVSMDQRNGHSGESTGPLNLDDPWDGYLSDQIAVMDHLGIDRFFALGFCIGCSFALGLAKKAPERVAGIVLCQPIGHRPEDPDVMYESGLGWGKDLIAKRPEVTMPMVEQMLHTMYRSPADFVYSVSRDFVASSQTPMLVLPGNDRPHPHEVGVEVASLAPRSETMDPWKQPEFIAQTIERVRSFLTAHDPLVAQ